MINVVARVREVFVFWKERLDTRIRFVNEVMNFGQNEYLVAWYVVLKSHYQFLEIVCENSSHLLDKLPQHLF